MAAGFDKKVLGSKCFGVAVSPKSNVPASCSSMRLFLSTHVYRFLFATSPNLSYTSSMRNHTYPLRCGFVKTAADRDVPGSPPARAYASDVDDLVLREYI